MYALEDHEQNGRVVHDNKIMQVFSVDSHSDFYLLCGTRQRKK